MKRNKKGFTIVELVIVIAVIAILSAILIPTFVSLTDRANESRAKSEVADAYTAYVIDAGDGFVGDTKTETSYPITLKSQTEVVVVRDNKNYTYSQEEGWKVNTPTGFPTGYSLIKQADNVEDAQLYNGCSVYLAD